MDQNNLPDKGSIREMLQARRPKKSPITAPSQRPGGSRIVVNDTVYFHQFGRQAIVPSKARYDLMLSGDEQPYVRPTLKVGEEWQPLDVGWVEKASMLHLINLEGSDLTRIPSKEEAHRIAQKVVLMGICVGEEIRPFAHLNPSPTPKVTGTDARFQPFDLKLFLRCLCGEARVQVAVYPF